jgi:hypothetical protein
MCHHISILCCIRGYAHVLAPDREFCESKVRGKYKKPPYLLMVRAGISLDPGQVWLRQEAKRGAQWRL